MKKLVFLLMAILVASSAFAVIDPDPNMMGLYFDEAADNPTMQMTTAGEVRAYIIITNPTVEAIKGFECGVSIQADPGFVYFDPSFANLEGQQGVFLVDFPNIFVAYNTPIPATEATVMGWVSVIVLTPEGVMNMNLGPAAPESIDDGLPAILLADDSVMPVGTSTLVGPAASINGEVVATESISLDNIKSLYR